jgi:hypothetical protein
VSPQAPLTTRATHLACHTLTDYLQLCQRRFEGNPPLQPHHSPFLLVFTLIVGHTGHRTPRSRRVYATAHAKSPFSRPTEPRCESFEGMEIGTMRLFDASMGGQHSLNSVQDIVEPCGQGHSGRHPTHKRVFHADRLTGRQGKRRKSPSGILTPWTKPFETLRTCTSTYRVCTGTCQYENIEIVCTWYVLCTSTGFSYWYVPSIYIMKFICESMYQYVLARDKTVFCGMMK